MSKKKGSLSFKQGEAWTPVYCISDGSIFQIFEDDKATKKISEFSLKDIKTLKAFKSSCAFRVELNKDDKQFNFKAANITEFQEWEIVVKPLDSQMEDKFLNNYTGGDIVGSSTWHFDPVKGLSSKLSVNHEFQWKRNGTSLFLFGATEYKNFHSEWKVAPNGYNFILKSGEKELVNYDYDEKTQIFIPRVGSHFDLQEWKFDGTSLSDRSGKEKWVIKGSVPLPVAFFVTIFTPEVEKGHFVTQHGAVYIAKVCERCSSNSCLKCKRNPHSNSIALLCSTCGSGAKAETCRSCFNSNGRICLAICNNCSTLPPKCISCNSQLN